MPPKVEPLSVPTAAKKAYRASIYPKKDAVDPELAELILQLEVLLERKLWVLIQTGDDRWSEISHKVYCGFREQKKEIADKERVGLLLHSPGGEASSAYKIVRIFQRRSEEFITVVPCYAKSAATLMALGGKEILMGSEAELGPLDVQLYDQDKDDWESALNAVQSLERLNAYALAAFDQAMQLLVPRTRKKLDVLMPQALEYAISIVKPLVEKIDTIDLTRKSRELKVAEDYAVRLMRPYYSHADAQRIASNLVQRFSTHEFVIDSAEAGSEGESFGRPINLGLKIAETPLAVEALFSKMESLLDRGTVIGRITEVKT